MHAEGVSEVSVSEEGRKAERAGAAGPNVRQGVRRNSRGRSLGRTHERMNDGPRRVFEETAGAGRGRI